MTGFTNLSDFIGRWRFTRDIRHSDGRVDLVDGVASFTMRGVGADYHEAGALRVGNREFTAERRYYWRMKGAEIVVEFEDGRFFHRFSPANPKAEHRCAPDNYRVRYEFIAPEWVAVWKVSGSRKSYTMRTHYSPLAE